MNQKAQKHLDKAASFIKKGDEFYAKAADEMIAAKVGTKNGPTWRDAAKAVGKSDTWVRDIVTSRTKFNAGSDEGEFRVDWTRGSHATTAEIEAGAEKLIETMPPARAAETIGRLASRPDVIEHLADEPEEAERVLHRPASDVWTRREMKDGTSKAPRVTAQANALTPLVIRNEIRLHLMKAAELATEHNLVGFFFEHVEDIRATLEMSVHGKNPKQAVADLEAWLADQEATT